MAKPEGAISLHIDELTDELITKVRAASTARIRSSARLKERVRHRIGRDAPEIRSQQDRPEPGHAEAASRGVPPGEGLVLVGTSTRRSAGLEALLTALPADFRWPIVVAQHMPATFTSALARG